MQEKTVRVLNVIYAQDDFYVMRVKDKKNGIEEKVAGNTRAAVYTSKDYTLLGEYKRTKYGNQFQFSMCQLILPETDEGLVRFLVDADLPGLAERTAKKLVKLYGRDVLEKMGDPKAIEKVRFISQKKAESIAEAWGEYRKNSGMESEADRELKIFLYGLGLGKGTVRAIASSRENEAEDKKEAKEMILENPYNAFLEQFPRMFEDYRSIGFKSCDFIALEKLHVKPDAPERMYTLVKHVMTSEVGTEGDMYISQPELFRLCLKRGNIKPDALTASVRVLLKEKHLIMDKEGCLWTSESWMNEQGIADNVARLLSRKIPEVHADIAAIEEAVNSNGRSIKYDDGQVKAIKTAMRKPFVVITGGPGTGKTTILDGIIHAHRLDPPAEGDPYATYACASTGRAAQRMYESIGIHAETIHRLLEYSPTDPKKPKKCKWYFKRCASLQIGVPEDAHGEDRKSDGRLLIVDEASMIDTSLMYHLLEAVPDCMRVILVGDSDQLPSVGPGNVLRDLIQSGKVPVIKLDAVHRQAQESRIITEAACINKGMPVNLRNGKSSDFVFMSRKDPGAALDTVINLVLERLPAFYNVKPEEIQVLAPMHKGLCGTENINDIIRKKLVDTSGSTDDALLNRFYEKQKRGRVFYKDDKVMQIRNNYDLGVFNGDTGFVRNVTAYQCTGGVIEATLFVEFDGHEGLVEIKSPKWDDLVLAYACTVHKSQGSEYNIVVLPMVREHYSMWERTLFYTAVTRAKKLLVIVGDSDLVARAVQNNPTITRKTRLAERLLDPGTFSFTKEEKEENHGNACLL